MNITITPLALQHVEDLHQVLDHVAREKRFLAFTQAPNREEASAFYQHNLDQGHVAHVALRNGRVVGWCDVLPTHGQARQHVGILGIGLLPDVRHQGIGRMLMASAIKAAQAKGMTRIELSVRTDNVNAKALYEHLGFAVEGLLQRAFLIDGTYYDAYAMALIGT